MVMLTNTSELAAAAEACLAAGVCILPADLKAKRVALPSWKAYQKRLPTRDELAHWLSPAGASAMCIVAGAVSGGIEMLDFDCQAEAFDAWCRLVEAEMPGLVGRLAIERSQGLGKHVGYRFEGIVPGSMKLAEKVCVAADPESAIYMGKTYAARKVGECYEYYPTLIETRGEGGIFLCAPSTGYILMQGRFEDLPIITAVEREVLLRCARSFNERPEMAPLPKVASAAGDRPGDGFNDRGDVRGVLRRHGWTKVRPGDNEHWRRPGKDDGWSATFNGQVFYCFTSSAPPFDLNRGYSKFQVYALLEHGGDYSKAASALRAQGYGSPQSPASSIQSEAQVVHPQPLPLDDPTPPAMPSGLLCGWMGLMAERIAEATETPIELSSLLCLAAVATAVQGKFSVRPEGGYFEPLNIWTAPAMKSGQRKTAVHRLATRPLLDWERAKCKEAAQEIKAVESQIKTLQARVAKLRSRCAAEDDAAQQEKLQQEIDQIESSMPQMPVTPRLFTQDVTPEHLGTMMAEQGEKMALLSDEGGIFDILAGRYSSGIPNLDLFLQAHSGSPARVDRGSRPSVILDHPLLTMGLSPQPDVLRALSNKPGFRGRGLLARFLYALPESKMGYRDLEPRQVPGHIADRYAEGIRILLDTPQRYDSQRNEFFPHVLMFSDAAYGIWKDHQRRVEVQLREGGRFGGMTDWAGKLPGAVARVAGLMHCAQFALEGVGPADRQIDEQVMGRAVQLGELLAEHALIIFDLMSDNGAMESARKLWRHIQASQMSSFSFSEIWHPLRGTFKTSEDIEPAVEMLLDHRLILPGDEGAALRRGRRGRRFIVNPRALEANGS